MKWKTLIAAVVLGLLLIWPSEATGQDDTSKLDTALDPRPSRGAVKKDTE